MRASPARRPRARGHVAAVLALVGLTASSGAAAPRVGGTRPALRLRDAWDRTLEVPARESIPVLLLYEDKASSTQNDALKKELAVLASGGAYRGRVALLAVADVADYAFWPAQALVKDAIQRESVRLATDIYCDWDGSVRGALGLRRGVSTVVLYARGGTTVFAYEGRLPDDKRAELLGHLRRELAS